MVKKLFVGNLSFETDEAALRRIFAPFGTVATAQLILDRQAGRSKGFAFVEMSTENEARAAILGLNGKDIEGRPVTVKEALAKQADARGPATRGRTGERRHAPALGSKLRRPPPAK